MCIRDSSSGAGFVEMGAAGISGCAGAERAADGFACEAIRFRVVVIAALRRAGAAAARDEIRSFSEVCFLGISLHLSRL